MQDSQPHVTGSNASTFKTVPKPVRFCQLVASIGCSNYLRNAGKLAMSVEYRVE